MKRLILFCAAVLLVVSVSVVCADGVPKQLQEACVTVRDDYKHRGSGVVITNEVDGKRTHWVLTVEHVVDNFRDVKTVIGADGQKRKRVTYRSATVSQEEREGTQHAGKTILEAEVVSADGERDLALMRIVKTDAIKGSIKFYKGKEAPPVGEDIYHCATPGMLTNAASLTAGIVCAHGRKFERDGFGRGEYDQTDAAGLPGSSGGMICLKKNGELVGVVSLGIRSGDSFHYFVPVRIIKAWLAEINAEWLMDPNAKITEADVKKIPLELTGFDDVDEPTKAKKKERENPDVNVTPAVPDEVETPLLRRAVP